MTETPTDAPRMSAQMLAALRRPFQPHQIGKLPRVTCRNCREASARSCGEHKAPWCKDCKSYISEKHIHLDYVGHAHITERLLEVDPFWFWIPVGRDQSGNPALDANGGLWIQLCVGGHNRLGYGAADGKRGGDAVKEAIGDALRNAAMRFGVGLELWMKEPADDDESTKIPSTPAVKTGPADGKEADEAFERIGAAAVAARDFPSERSKLLKDLIKQANLAGVANRQGKTGQTLQAFLLAELERADAQASLGEPVSS